MNVLDIVAGTSVDGPGLRTSVYFAGCRHACPGCHNPQSWSFTAGTPMTVDEIVAAVELENFNVTLTGGDPLYQPFNSLEELCRRLRQNGRNIWLYTGFTIEEILADENLRPIVGLVDTIVEGPFVEALRDTSLRFRGSSNQRIIPTSEL